MSEPFELEVNRFHADVVRPDIGAEQRANNNDSLILRTKLETLVVLLNFSSSQSEADAATIGGIGAVHKFRSFTIQFGPSAEIGAWLLRKHFLPGRDQ